MKIAFFDSHGYERPVFQSANAAFGHEIHFFEPRLTSESAKLAAGFPVVCSFVNDRVDEGTLRILSEGGVGLVALRSAGFNHIDLAAARRLGLKVTRVPEYSPYAVAEHAVALLLTLNRKVHKAHARVHDLNFSLEGLVGFDLHGKTVGVLGTGRIGAAFARIMRGFGCRVFAYDANPSVELEREGIMYREATEIYRESDILSLHLPLTPGTRHMIDDSVFNAMKPGVLLINTGRGGLIDSKALLQALKAKKLGGAGLDVYEEEEGIFFNDLSTTGIDDDALARLLTFPNVVITAHQAFLTKEALHNIAEATLSAVSEFETKRPLTNEVRVLS